MMPPPLHPFLFIIRYYRPYCPHIILIIIIILTILIIVIIHHSSPSPTTHHPPPLESLDSLELLYGEAVSRADIDGIEAEEMRLLLVQKRLQEKKDKLAAAKQGSLSSSFRTYRTY